MDKATETLLKLRNDPVLFVEKVLKATPQKWQKEALLGIQKNDKVENLFEGMSIYAENPNYTNILGNVYKNRIQPVLQTENFLLPKRKPITEQMDSLQ